MKNILKLTCIAVACTIYSTTEAQNQVTNLKSFSRLIGYGQQINNIRCKYNPIFLQYDLEWPLGRSTHNTVWAYYLEPQFNLVFTERPLDIELGNNIGLRLYELLSKKVYLYQMIGSGPHFITAVIPGQANGFIFSDNFAIGFLIKEPRKNFFLNLQLKLRHISNAGIKEPNKGVNTGSLVVGITKIK